MTPSADARARARRRVLLQRRLLLVARRSEHRASAQEQPVGRGTSSVEAVPPAAAVATPDS